MHDVTIKVVDDEENVVQREHVMNLILERIKSAYDIKEVQVNCFAYIKDVQVEVRVDVVKIEVRIRSEGSIIIDIVMQDDDVSGNLCVAQKQIKEDDLDIKNSVF